jgi:hypothetical protein
VTVSFYSLFTRHCHRGCRRREPQKLLPWFVHRLDVAPADIDHALRAKHRKQQIDTILRPKRNQLRDEPATNATGNPHFCAGLERIFLSRQANQAVNALLRLETIDNIAGYSGWYYTIGKYETCNTWTARDGIELLIDYQHENVRSKKRSSGDDAFSADDPESARPRKVALIPKISAEKGLSYTFAAGLCVGYRPVAIRLFCGGVTVRGKQH